MATVDFSVIIDNFVDGSIKGKPSLKVFGLIGLRSRFSTELTKRGQE